MPHSTLRCRSTPTGSSLRLPSFLLPLLILYPTVRSVTPSLSVDAPTSAAITPMEEETAAALVLLGESFFLLLPFQARRTDPSLAPPVSEVAYVLLFFPFSSRPPHFSSPFAIPSTHHPRQQLAPLFLSSQPLIDSRRFLRLLLAQSALAVRPPADALLRAVAVREEDAVAVEEEGVVEAVVEVVEEEDPKQARFHFVLGVSPSPCLS